MLEKNTRAYFVDLIYIYIYIYIYDEKIFIILTLDTKHVLDQPEKLVRDKHSNLFCRSNIYDEKIFIIQTLET